MQLALQASYLAIDEGESIRVPFGQVVYEYGVADKLDAGISISSAFNALINVKYQLIGDQESRFALALNPGLEFQLGGDDGFFLRPHFSAPLSLDLDDKFTLFAEPKYIYQTIDGTHFPGFSGGLQVTLYNDWKFAIGASSFYPLVERGVGNTRVFQVGVSFRKLMVR